MSSFWKNLIKSATPFLGNVPIVGGLLQNTAEGMMKDYETQESYNRNMAYQSQLMQLQNQYNVDMFNRQQEVNNQSIVNQMNQYRSLGINPLMVTGGIQQANQSAPGTSSIPSPFEPQSPLQSAQIDLMQSEASKNRAEAKATEERLPSEIRANTAEANYKESLTTTENGMRVYKIRDAENNCSLTVARENLTRSQKDYYVKLQDSLQEQINESRANQRLLDEKKISEQFYRTQQELMNKAQMKYLERQARAAIMNANSNAANVALAWERWKTVDKTLYENQSEYWKQFTENLKKDGKLKDCEVSFAENTLDMRFQAFGAEWLYHITELEDGTKRVQLDLEYLNKHGGLILKKQLAEDMNAVVLSYFTPAIKHAEIGSKVAGVAAGSKILGGLSSGSSPQWHPLPSEPHSQYWLP